MSLIIQKFGGTSVANTQKILAAARKAIRAAKEGHKVIMVLSAMGKTTDDLIALAKQITNRPSTREMDMLMATGEQVTISLMAIALESLGYKAISFTGTQIGILTDAAHTKARIRSISTETMRRSLNEGNIVIAAGFQGVSEGGDVTTLGRGGSDTTAVALAAALGADACEIYTDVDGVYSTDPRLVPEARQLDRISYDEMLEMASLGAGVMHSRSIEFAKKYNVPVVVRNSASDAAGTWIVDTPESPTEPVCGAALAKDEARVTLVGAPDRPGVAMALFTEIADAKIATDMIVQNISSEGRTDISFTVVEDDLPQTVDVVKKVAEKIGALNVETDLGVAKVSVIGLGMEKQPGVARRMFRSLADRGINISMITTSEIKISALVDQSNSLNALQAAHEAFALHIKPDDARGPVILKPGEIKSPDKLEGEYLSRLTGMEDTIIESITLDATQSRITLNGVPDVPGLAANVFERIAKDAVVVDMIVQSVGRSGLANISFTVPRDQLQTALVTSTELSQTLKSAPPTCNPKVAKIVVRGTGLRSHTGLASRIFRTLSGEGINVTIINTGERSINVTVGDEQGAKACELLKREFAKDTL
ncbi:MAG: aspartate kinase [Planctomycetaceae bacterium]|jgi:aspartate kinase|nr:aspartate kinase [Planctomycetaceae bacterium]